jgi:hypothetical protein
MTIQLAGTAYVVESNHLDRHGRGLYEPSSILICNEKPEGTPKQGSYGRNEHFGLLPTHLVPILLNA